MKRLSIEEKQEYANLYEAARKLTPVVVENLDNTEYREPFNDKLIVVPANGKITMPYGDAMRFKATGPFIGKDGKSIKKAIKVHEPLHQDIVNNIVKADTSNGFYDPLLKEDKDVYVRVDTNEPTEDEEILRCPICERKFETPRGLGMHMIKSHK